MVRGDEGLVRIGDQRRRREAAVVCLALGLSVAALAEAAPDRSAGAAPAVVVGAVYPTAGPQAPTGREELHGVELAAAYQNARGGVRGRPLRLHVQPADRPDAAPGAVAALARAGIPVVVGSHGSTISRPAAEAASRRGLVFWETGAVGDLGMETLTGRRVFRYAPTGAVLGEAGVTFVRTRVLGAPLAAARGRARYAVVYVDDVYGQSLARGAVRAIAAAGDVLAARLPYDPGTADYLALADRIAAARAEVLVVAAYLQDAVALRHALVARRVRLRAEIGSSSSHCMPEFGRLLGPAAVGVFASDKPDGDVVHPDRLAPEARHALAWGRAQFTARTGRPMSGPALSGFAGGLALFGHVLPAAIREAPVRPDPGAGRLDPAAVAAAAVRVRLPVGALPDGGGLDLAPPGHPDAGANRRAVHVIWQWVRPGVRAVVWPPAYATHPVVPP